MKEYTGFEDFFYYMQRSESFFTTNGIGELHRTQEEEKPYYYML